MDEKPIRDAVNEFTTNDFNNIGEKRALEVLLDLANSYISAIESGVPEEKCLKGFKLGGSIYEFRRGFNASRSLMLLLLAKLELRIKEVVRDGDSRSQGLMELVAKLKMENEELKATMSLDLIRKLQSTLAEKDREIEEIINQSRVVAKKYTEIQSIITEKDQRIAKLEERLIKTTEAGLKVCEEASKSHPAVGKEEIEKVIKDNLEFKNIVDIGCSGFYMRTSRIGELAQAIADLINGKG